ncbi:hypothetical protein ACQJBY_015831 [Aegilops geniculata]
MDATKRQQQQHDEEALSNSSPPASSSWASTSSSSCLPGSGDTDRAPLLPCKMADDEKVDRLDVSDDTAHQISVDPWYQVGFVLTTGVNSAYVLGYSGSIMVPLGWIGGTCGLILAAAISMYANALLGRLHEIGGKRHIRYRDLAGHIYGRKMYALTWALQYINLFMINTGFIILAGQALKAIYVLFRDDGLLKLPYCIALSGHNNTCKRLQYSWIRVN